MLIMSCFCGVKNEEREWFIFQGRGWCGERVYVEIYK